MRREIAISRTILKHIGRELTEEDTVLVFAKNSVTETVRKLFIA